MLDIKAIGYISPVAEVPFTDTPLTVHLVNIADETGLVTGRFRVYNTTTGALIHTSEIAPLSLAAGQSVDVTALTDFDPPAPLDGTYFVVFDGHAHNALVPDGIGIFLGAFHFDVKVGPLGPAPAAHAVTHEDGGSDPIDVTNMPGLLADAQTPLPHHATHEPGNPDRVLPVVVSEASSATPTPDSDLCDMYDLSALAEAAEFQAPDGTPTDGQKLIIRILDDGTARALTWVAGAGGYIARGAALPATTVISKYFFVGLIYNATANTWDCVATSQEI